MSDVKVDLRKFKEKREDDVVKVDLREKPVKEEEDAVQEQSAEESVLDSVQQSEESGEETHVGLQEVEEGNEKKVEEIKQEDEEAPVIMEVQDEEEKEKPAQEKVEEPVAPQINLPENIEKLVDFINDTGGTIEDYARLNADYSNVDEDTLLREYYKNTKSHLDHDEVSFLIEENFHYDEDIDNDRDVKRKKLAKKEEIAKAHKFLDNLKVKYYEEIKSRPTVSNEQKEAMEFFNRYNEEKEESLKRNEGFKERTKKFFTDDFKGFDFKIGEKKFRYGLKDSSSVADVQSEVNNVLGKFLDNKGSVKNMNEYHKALYAASNIDTIASHFYEQGKADAVKDIEKSSKNISNEPGRTSPENVFVNGLKVKAVDGVDSSKLKIKRKA
jgi:hypothetical protein